MVRIYVLSSLHLASKTENWLTAAIYTNFQPLPTTAAKLVDDVKRLKSTKIRAYDFSKFFTFLLYFFYYLTCSFLFSKCFFFSIFSFQLAISDFWPSGMLVHRCRVAFFMVFGYFIWFFGFLLFVPFFVFYAPSLTKLCC